ncbi:allophanate hydrolase [Millisia brevis]|uniref:allophanate hydrolase n=1 Tax=Millisia brevis TaxID=264148 RepID=UPI00082EAF00|nr:allophanate hydrolase [Millisia brevis]
MAPASGPTLGPSIVDILDSHLHGSGSPTSTAARVADAIAARGADGVWITVRSRDELLAAAQEIEERPDARMLPLYGVPFGVKDSIDVAGDPTTLSCPGYGYVAEQTAPVVQALLDAGALYVGKVSLDQFATGLNGTRTPHPIARNVYGQNLIPGGSSTGSAVAVALGEVPFCVSTDTAGSGRVPAALNGVVGYKPSRGLISTVGLVPACRSLDCIAITAGRVDDIDRVAAITMGRDDGDAWSRDAGPHYAGETLRIGLPAIDKLDFFGDTAMRQAHIFARSRISALGFPTTSAPLEPFLAAGELLYQGPWVAERLVEFDDFLTEHPDEIVPVVREIFKGGRKYTAVDAFRALQRLQSLKAEVDRLWRTFDVLVLPTIGTTFTVDEVLADPIATNTVLGHYTHFGNLLDLAAVSVPTGVTDDGRPAAAMIIGPALSDGRILEIAARLLDEPRDFVADTTTTSTPANPSTAADSAQRSN